MRKERDLEANKTETKKIGIPGRFVGYFLV